MVIPRFQRPERGITVGNRGITDYAEASTVKKPLPLSAFLVTSRPAPVSVLANRSEICYARTLK